MAAAAPIIPQRKPSGPRPSGPIMLFIRLSFRLILLACFAFAGGFGWFVNDALRPPGYLPHADGIVALTGGAGRIDTSLNLLARNQGEKLLISGVDTQTTLGELLPPTAPPALAERITLGYQARSTIGNATETAVWVADNHITSLIVVTASYHMRRALLELSRTLPDVTLYPYPVLPPAMEHPLRRSSLRILALEYLKWLGALGGFTSPSLSRALHS